MRSGNFSWQTYRCCCHSSRIITGPHCLWISRPDGRKLKMFVWVRQRGTCVSASRNWAEHLQRKRRYWASVFERCVSFPLKCVWRSLLSARVFCCCCNQPLFSQSLSRIMRPDRLVPLLLLSHFWHFCNSLPASGFLAALSSHLSLCCQKWGEKSSLYSSTVWFGLFNQD